MKCKSLITAGLLAVGLISAASSQAVVVTLTGSSAFRAVVYTACKAPGVVFASAASGAPADPVVVSATDANSAGDIVYEGYIQNTDLSYTKYDLVCSFTGSEAGIAAVCGLTTLANSTPNRPGGPTTSPMPGVPPGYLTEASGWLTKSTTTYTTDLALSDTSQAVSLTKNTGGATALVGGETVGIVPFVWMKGKNSLPTNSWPRLTNLTHPAAKLVMSGPVISSFFTGTDTDADAVVVVGRNKGSGTRVNQLLDLGIPLTVPVDQFVINSAYNGSGALTNGPTSTVFTDAQLFEVGNDGFDSGGSVANCLRMDGKFSTYIPIGFMGIPDAIGLPIHTGGAESGGAVLLTVDGFPESNANVELGRYTAWGHEKLYGKNGLLSTDPAGKVRAKLLTGLPSTLTSLGWGTVAASQDAAIPASLMLVDKSGDVGYPFPL